MAEKQCSSSGCTKESCEGCPSKNKPTSFQVASNEYTKVKHVIGVVSGKGGVGKSMVTASLANLMAEKGYRVGILDADITGPSIPKMYGLHGPAQADDNGIYPPLAENDIKVMSINLLMPDEEAPVIWRGPVISGMVKQFWTDVIWGELDYLVCPDCGKKISVFGESHIEEIASKMDLKVLGKMPIDPSLAELSDKGDFAKAANQYLTDAFEVLHRLDRVKKEEE